MPFLGADMSEGTLLAWLRQPGDAVKRGDIIAEVHTDKADVEIEVFTAGIVEKLLVEPGATVPVGTPLAIIGDGMRSRPSPAIPPAGHRLLVSPSARHLAAELDVELAGLVGTGPGGRIQRVDVERAAAPRPARAQVEAVEAPAVAPPPTPAAPPPVATAAPDDRRVGMRRAIAAAMTRSKREIPHFTVGETIDLSASMRWLQEENLRRTVERRLLAAVLILKAVALGLRDVPELNATWQGDRLVQGDAVHLGTAIFLRGGGLIAPAIHAADTLPLDELMDRFRDLVARARAGKLRGSELSDPTFTVTSLGERGAESVVPIIFPPQVAIAGFGRIVERPWVSDGQLLVCPTVAATIAADHRVTDGHGAGALLASINRHLQEPDAL
jgi:pyruvate dehydrogenase E2 component (dihydrolipoamide acetyltransferase)